MLWKLAGIERHDDERQLLYEGLPLSWQRTGGDLRGKKGELADNVGGFAWFNWREQTKALIERTLRMNGCDQA
jgi:hypothetical protein